MRRRGSYALQSKPCACFFIHANDLTRIRQSWGQWVSYHPVEHNTASAAVPDPLLQLPKVRRIMFYRVRVTNTNTSPQTADKTPCGVSSQIFTSLCGPAKRGRYVPDEARGWGYRDCLCTGLRYPCFLF